MHNKYLQFLRIQKHIPNIFTISNLTCGLLSILFAFQSDLTTASFFILSGLFFDFFDGLLARLLKVSGELGKQLDSLADLITFGVAPSIIVLQLIINAQSNLFFNQINLMEYPLCFVSFLIPIFSALRLAKFNIDNNQSSNFIGLATPANALFFISIPLIIEFHPNSTFLEVIKSLEFLILATILFSFLLVSKINLFSFKLKNTSWKDNKSQYSFIAISIILLLAFRFVAMPFILLLYIVISLLNKTNEIQS